MNLNSDSNLTENSNLVNNNTNNNNNNENKSNNDNNRSINEKNKINEVNKGKKIISNIEKHDREIALKEKNAKFNDSKKRNNSFKVDQLEKEFKGVSANVESNGKSFKIRNNDGEIFNEKNNSKKSLKDKNKNLRINQDKVKDNSEFVSENIDMNDKSVLNYRDIKIDLDKF